MPAATSIRWAPVAYFLLTGRPPFESENPMRVLVMHAHDDVVSPSRLRPDLPADLEQVVMRCLAKNPGQRYQSAASLARALNECESSGEWSREQAANWWAQIREPSAVAAG